MLVLIVWDTPNDVIDFKYLLCGETGLSNLFSRDDFGS